MTIEFSRPDDGTPEWAAEEAAGMIGVAMIRADKELGAKGAAAVLASISSFALSMIQENPRLWAAHCGETVQSTQEKTQ